MVDSTYNSHRNPTVNRRRRCSERNLTHHRGAEGPVVALGDTAELAGSPFAADPDQAAVARAVASLKRADGEVRSRIIDNRRGLAPEIAREVMATGADMIVLGTRTLGWEGGDVSAGAAEALIHRTCRPAVVAPSRRR